MPEEVEICADLHLKAREYLGKMPKQAFGHTPDLESSFLREFAAAAIRVVGTNRKISCHLAGPLPVSDSFLIHNNPGSCCYQRL